MTADGLQKFMCLDGLIVLFNERSSYARQQRLAGSSTAKSLATSTCRKKCAGSPKTAVRGSRRLNSVCCYSCAMSEMIQGYAGSSSHEEHGHAADCSSGPADDQRSSA